MTLEQTGVNPRIITIAERNVLGWPGERPGPAEGLDLAEALSEAWSTDKHFQAIAPGTPCRRMNVARLDDAALAKAPVQMVLRVLDVDMPEHAARTEAWTAELRASMARLPIPPLVYWTTGGARLLWALAKPFAIGSRAAYARWVGEQKAAIRHLWAYGIYADDACCDPSRLYRLPNVRRDGKRVASPLEGELRTWDYATPADVELDAVDRSASKAPPVETMRLVQAMGQHRVVGEGKAAVRCPWEASHSDFGKRDGLAGGTIVFATGDGEGYFFCSHTHCAKRGQNDAREAVGLAPLVGSDIERLAPLWLRHNPHASDVPWYMYEGGVWRPMTEAETYGPLIARVPQLGELARAPGKQVAQRTKLLRQHEQHVLAEPELDPSPDILCCPNGIVDLAQGTLAEHAPDWLCSRQTGVAYDPSLDTKDVRRLVLNWCSGKADVAEDLWSVIGYTLTGRANERLLPWLLGPKGSGKTTFLELLQYTMGSYAVQVQSGRTWVDDRGREPTDSIRSTRGCRLAWTDELPRNGRWREDVVKSFTGGGSSIAAEAKYKSRVQWTQRCKLWLASNHEPADADDALASRIRVYRFDGTFKDRTFKDKLFGRYAGAFLCEGVRWARRVIEHKGLWDPPGEVQNATAEATESELGGYLVQYAADGQSVSAAALLARIQRDRPDLNITSAQKLGRRMSEFSRVYPRAHKEGGACYLNIRLPEQ